MLEDDADVAAEIADLLYFTLVKSVAAGIKLEEVVELLDMREKRVSRRAMRAKEVE
ncbi:MAG: hypothetical protein ACLFVZ_11960 [Actinomycetota bacterium]